MLLCLQRGVSLFRAAAAAGAVPKLGKDAKM